jgi:hypothetical protein
MAIKILVDAEVIASSDLATDVVAIVLECLRHPF